MTGIAAATLLFAASFFILPYKRKRAVENFRSKVEELRADLAVMRRELRRLRVLVDAYGLDRYRPSPAFTLATIGFLASVAAKGEVMVEGEVADDPLGDAIRLMDEGDYRHLPIVDKAGRVEAVISIQQIIQFLAELYPAEVLNLPPEPHQYMDSREGG